MSEIQELVQEIAKAKVAAEQLVKMERLKANPDFRDLIVQGFIVDECARHARLSVDVDMSEEDRKDALGFAQAAGYLQRWIEVFCKMATTASDDIADMENTLAEMRAEELGDQS